MSPRPSFCLVMLVACGSEPQERQNTPASPASLRAAYIASRQAEGALDERYHLVWEGAEVVAHTERGLQAWFDGRGVAVATESLAGRLDTRSIRCGGREVASRTAPPELDATLPNRLSRYHGDGTHEWWLSGPLGLEQGFDLDLSDCDDEVSIELETAGFEASMKGRDVRLAAAGSGAALRYGDLYAHDRRGATLPSRFNVLGATVQIVVDVSAALWPIRIDPLLYLDEQRIAPDSTGDGDSIDVFGDSVALSGDTALVGANNDAVGTRTGQGSAYVFVRSGTTWSLQARLVAADGALDDHFGTSVALVGDTALVGASFQNVGGNTDQGSAYVFVRSGTTWTQEQKLTASDGASTDLFGSSVALSGDTAVVGAPNDGVGASLSQGSAYVFTRSGTVWTEQQKLVASDGAANDSFGFSVAVDGDTALVGASTDSFGAVTSQGSAYVFTRSGTAWTEQQKLFDAAGEREDNYGASVALSGDTALIGVDWDNVTSTDQGSARVYTRTAGVWSLEQELTAADAAGSDLFGGSVALVGDTAVVGAWFDDSGTANRGSLYVFTRAAGMWTQRTKLTASDAFTDDRLGNAVAMSGGTILAGAYFDDVDENANQGSAYVFTGSGATWSQEQKLTAGQSAAGDRFGTGVAVDGDTAIVGAPYDNVNGSSNRGAAYVYVRTGPTWSLQAKLTASDGTADDAFGLRVALDGETAVVSAYGDLGFQGSVYVFVRAGTTWSQQAKLTASDGGAGDRMGYGLAFSGDTVVAGGYFDNVGSSVSQGSAYVFIRSGATWSQQAKLTASDGQASDYFGFSVSLSGDTALIGARGVSGSSGAAYVFTRAGTVWTEQAKLVASGGTPLEYLGLAVALEGDIALVGGNGNGQRVVAFTRAGTSWSQTAALVPSGGTSGLFGSALALRDKVVLIGAPGDDTGVVNRGSVRVFSLAGGAWREEGELFASDGLANDEFGSSVALDGATTLVGAPIADSRVYDNLDEGAAYFGSLEGTDAAGTVCGSALTCASGMCVDGVCCDDPCGGGGGNDCYACSIAAGAAADGTCAALTGTSCDDAAFCNGADTCVAGACAAHGGDPCPGADGDGDCSETCNEVADDCSSNDTDGSACTDGIYCNGADSCTGGSCTMHAGDPCPGADGDSDCSETCDEVTDACDANDTDGSSCDDGLYCNGADSCGSGLCTHAGDPCPGADYDDDCSETCDESADACTGNDADGTSCDDGLFCTGNDVCSAGQCFHPGPPCPGADGDGNCAESCNEAANDCSANDTDGSGCDDGWFCNGVDTCSAGSCAHAGDPCPGADGDGDCSESCDEIADACSANDTNGSPCDDGFYCTLSDSCDAGGCSGTGDPCPGADGDGDCSETCNEDAGDCSANDTNGSSCDDGSFCNGTETCSGGACGGSSGDPCAGPDGDNDCSESCDESGDTCSGNDLDSSLCDDGIFCNGAETCTGSVCGGSSGDPCAGSVGDGDGNCVEACNEVAGDCSGAEPDGTSCNDPAVDCPGAESCSNAVCGCPALGCPGPDGDGDCAESYDAVLDTCAGADPDGSECDGGVCESGICVQDQSGGNARASGCDCRSTSPGAGMWWLIAGVWWRRRRTAPGGFK